MGKLKSYSHVQMRERQFNSFLLQVIQTIQTEFFRMVSFEFITPKTGELQDDSVKQ